MRDWLPAGRLRELLPFLVDPATKLRQLVPVAIRHRIWQRRTLQSFRDLHPESLRRLSSGIGLHIDADRLRRLHERHRGNEEIEELSDHERKLEVAIVKALLAGLYDVPRQRILDLGCGGGYFVAVSRYLGHACEGTEVPASRLSAATAAAYVEVSAALGVSPTIELAIAANTPIDVPAIQPRAYDLITAHKVCFNGHMRPTRWSTPEWRFFVTDVCRFLAPGGRLILDLNEDVAHYGARRWYDAELANYFGSVGRVERSRITIEPDRR